MFSHFDFVVHYNEDRVIEISVTTDTASAADISLDRDTEVTFSYSVRWVPTTIPYEK